MRKSARSGRAAGGPAAAGQNGTAFPWSRLFIEALRLDREPLDAVRRRAEAALEAGVAGFILFGGRAGTVRTLCADLRERSGRPLWLAADLERGAGQQFSGATELPPPRALATHPRPEEAVRTAAALTGREAREAGLNWVFAPVLDLDVEPRNPIVGTRAFGPDPERVAELGLAWVEACQAEGVAACAKHFPGHGRTMGDSHLELPAVMADRALLEADLLPFRAVARRSATMMTAHVAYPALGADGAATFSRAVLTDLLRGELGFEGLVVSDALVMEGFRAGAERGPEDRAGAHGAGGLEAEGEADVPAHQEGSAAARALKAGCDLLLYPEELRRAAAGLARAAARDAEVAARAREALRRSEALLERYAPGRLVALEGEEPPPEGAELPPEGEGRRELAIRLAAECLQARGQGLGSGCSRQGETEILWLSEDAAPGEDPPGTALAGELRRLGWRVTASRPLGERDAPDGGDGAGPVQRLVVVRSTPRAWKGHAGLPGAAAAAVRRAVGEGATSVAVVLAHERVLEDLEVPGLCAWAAEAVMERAAARWLDERAG